MVLVLLMSEYSSVELMVSLMPPAPPFLTASLKISSAVTGSRKLVLKPGAYVTEEWAGAECGLVIMFHCSTL